jgi:hypothetical protein
MLKGQEHEVSSASSGVIELKKTTGRFAHSSRSGRFRAAVP